MGVSGGLSLPSDPVVRPPSLDQSARLAFFAEPPPPITSQVSLTQELSSSANKIV